MKALKILVACEESQAVTKEFRKLGHEAYSCDNEHFSGDHPEWHIKDDVLKILDNGWDIMIAHPPCTRLSNSGVRWLHVPPKDKTLVQIWEEFFDGCEFYKAIRNAKIKKKAIENPVMHPHAVEVIGKIKRQVVQPWWFGDKTFKATGFELHGLPDLIPTDKLIPPKKGTEEYKEWSWVHRLSPSKDRSVLRSKTQPGTAKAMAQQWSIIN